MFFSQIGVHWHRLFGAAWNGWLVALDISCEHGHLGGGSVDASMPQARAVVDDFGTLVCVTGFR